MKDFKEHCRSVLVNAKPMLTRDGIGAMKDMDKILQSLREDEKNGIGALKEVLGLEDSVNLWYTDAIDAAFRMVFMKLFGG